MSETEVFYLVATEEQEERFVLRFTEGKLSGWYRYRLDEVEIAHLVPALPFRNDFYQSPATLASDDAPDGEPKLSDL